ncbi:CesT family type III secretion system chaperone [Lacisediminimonas sp.]|uniref:CesT family type III secretion system chaperone n=1 Tax=Lacisediminimonas sp. TaxID=3060582 RepID=UPI0027246EB9|nr:CesT family type III secretion system chaperone [Lacisediminimonas sp.]MDO8300135.1 CesT family type III secretion system chaperone [Lacisediminimonas sp.]
MAWIEQSISEFGRSIGIASLALDAGGGLRLGTESGGAIEVHHQREFQPPVVLVMMSEPVGFNRGKRLRTAMRLADFRRRPTVPVLVALDADQLVLATRMDERSFSHPALESVLDQLERLHQQIASAD